MKLSKDLAKRLLRLSITPTESYTEGPRGWIVLGVGLVIFAYLLVLVLAK